MNTWRFGRLREELFQIPKGTFVAYRKTNIKHRSLGTTWWVMSKKHANQVAETYGGKNMVNLIAVSYKDPLPASIDVQVIEKQLRNRINRYEKPNPDSKL